MTRRGTNWIGGAERPARGGAWFEIADAAGRAPLARRPRSTAEDLEDALDAALDAERGWRALGRAQRGLLLARAAESLLAAPDPEDLARAALGFTAAELERHLEGLDAALADALAGSPELARGPLGAREGAAVLVPSWSATWHAPARAAFFALLAGRPVVLAPDGRAAAVGDALRDAGRDLPPGVLAVLHDDGRTLARAALAARHAATVVVAAERLDPLAVSAPHVVVAHARRRSAVVDPGQDVAAQVERALDLALGRARALSGSRGGCVGRLIVPARHYARVCDLALSGVERSSDARRPLPVALATQADRLASCLSLGLGEGATALVAGLLDGGAPFPLLFANVEPAMRLAQDPLPCAALLLLRARDLRAAHALAGRLDREVRS